jgi:hypothetical protein
LHASVDLAVPQVVIELPFTESTYKIVSTWQLGRNCDLSVPLTQTRDDVDELFEHDPAYEVAFVLEVPSALPS